MTSVSVVIPCYNGEKYLAATLDAIFNQTRPANEVLVVDDCSTDGSRDVAVRYDVNLLSTEVNSRQGTARNLGIREAGGEFIAFLDADDVWLPIHLERLVPLLERHPIAAIAFSRHKCFGLMNHEQDAILEPDQVDDAFWACLRQNVVTPSCSIVRRTAAMAIGGFDVSVQYGEDYDFFLRLSRHHKFLFHDAVTVLYRTHSGQDSKSLHQFRRSEFEVRKRFLEGSRSSESEDFVSRFEEVTREAWEGRLKQAWWERDSDLMRFYLSLGELIPAPESISRRWWIMARLIWTARLWDMLPEVARAKVRRFVPGRS